MTWVRSQRYHLENSYLAVEPDGLGAWFVLDVRKPDRRLGGVVSRRPLAQRMAERRLSEHPEQYGVKLDLPPEIDHGRG